MKQYQTCLSLFFGLLMQVSGQSDSPNVILIMSDDQGWGDVGFNGHPVLKTPHLDEMARNGMRFDRFYAASPLCSPTRGSCLTGRYPFRYGILAAHTGGMRTGEVTIAEALKKKDYVTAFFGKWHIGWLELRRWVHVDSFLRPIITVMIGILGPLVRSRLSIPG